MKSFPRIAILSGIGAQYAYLLYRHVFSEGLTFMAYFEIFFVGLLLLLIIWIAYYRLTVEEENPDERLRWGFYCSWSVLLFFPVWWSIGYLIPLGRLIWIDEPGLTEVVRQVEEVPALHHLFPNREPEFYRSTGNEAGTSSKNWKDVLALRTAMKSNGVISVSCDANGDISLHTESGRTYLHATGTPSPAGSLYQHLRGPWYLWNPF